MGPGCGGERRGALNFIDSPAATELLLSPNVSLSLAAAAYAEGFNDLMGPRSPKERSRRRVTLRITG